MIKGTYDLKAALFVDVILENLTDTGIKELALGKINDGDYARAALVAITGLSKEVSTRTIDQYISELSERRVNGNGV
jgi:hypothetical protein